MFRVLGIYNFAQKIPLLLNFTFSLFLPTWWLFLFDFLKCANKFACKYDCAKISCRKSFNFTYSKGCKADRGIRRKVKSKIARIIARFNTADQNRPRSKSLFRSQRCGGVSSLVLFMFIIQEWFLIQSRLWWRKYGIFFIITVITKVWSINQKLSGFLFFNNNFLSLSLCFFLMEDQDKDQADPWDHT